MELKTAQALLAKIPRVDLGFYPTPLHRLNTISRDYGVEFYLKRDDLSGPEFGGNKIRKLEFLLAEAIGKGAEYVFTFGAHQSNHARETAAACRKCGLRPVLYLLYIPGGEPPETLGNLLLDRVLGAEVRYINPEPGMGAYETVERSYSLATEHVARLEAEGHRCYIIPIGGLDPVGCLGFASGLVELAGQLQAAHAGMDFVAHATGSGGTLAGLLAGRRLLEGVLPAGLKVLPFSVDAEPPGKAETVADLATKTLGLLGTDLRVTPEEVVIDPGYVGEGYEIPTPESTAAIQELARKEGVILDPVYTAKGMAGVLDYIKRGRIPQGSRVVFWHTGGTPAMFAEKEIVGSFG